MKKFRKHLEEKLKDPEWAKMYQEEKSKRALSKKEIVR